MIIPAPLSTRFNPAPVQRNELNRFSRLHNLIPKPIILPDCAWRLLLTAIFTLISLPANSFAASPHDFTSRIVSADNIRMPFFSTNSGNRFATLSLDSVKPARKRIGPFAMAAPGHDIHNLSLTITRLECTADDWRNLLTHLRAMKDKAKGDLILTLPEEELGPVQLLGTNDGFIAFRTKPATARKNRQIVTISHENNQLRIRSQSRSHTGHRDSPNAETTNPSPSQSGG